jgi:hypothetical protein
MAQLFITITFPTGVPTVDRTFQLRGNISFSTPSTWSLISKSMSVQFGPGGQLVAGTFPSGNNWQCTGTVVRAADAHRAGHFPILPHAQ